MKPQGVCLLIAGTVIFCLCTQICLAATPPASDDTTIQQLRQAVLASPQDPAVHDALGIALANSGQFPEAISQMRVAIWISPLVSSYQRDLNDVLAESGDTKEAEAGYQALITRDPDDSDSLLGLAQIYRLSGQTQNAVTEYMLAEHLDPMNYTTHFELGSEMLALDKFDIAQLQFEFCLCLNPTDLASLTFLSTAESEQGDIVDSLATLNAAMALPGLTSCQLSQLNVHLGALMLQEGRSADAITALKQAEQLDPLNPQVRNALGAALYASGDKVDAASEWKVALSSKDADAQETAKQWLTLK